MQGQSLVQELTAQRYPRYTPFGLRDLIVEEIEVDREYRPIGKTYSLLLFDKHPSRDREGGNIPPVYMEMFKGEIMEAVQERDRQREREMTAQREEYMRRKERADREWKDALDLEMQRAKASQQPKSSAHPSEKNLTRGGGSLHTLSEKSKQRGGGGADALSRRSGGEGDHTPSRLSARIDSVQSKTIPSEDKGSKNNRSAGVASFKGSDKGSMKEGNQGSMQGSQKDKARDDPSAGDSHGHNPGLPLLSGGESIRTAQMSKKSIGNIVGGKTSARGSIANTGEKTPGQRGLTDNRLV